MIKDCIPSFPRNQQYSKFVQGRGRANGFPVS